MERSRTLEVNISKRCCSQGGEKKTRNLNMGVRGKKLQGIFWGMERRHQEEVTLIPFCRAFWILPMLSGSARGSCENSSLAQLCCCCCCLSWLSRG